MKGTRFFNRFSGKNFIWASGPGSTVRIFFKNLPNEWGQYVDEHHINNCLQKFFLFGENGSFWAQNWCILITLDLL